MCGKHAYYFNPFVSKIKSIGYNTVTVFSYVPKLTIIFDKSYQGGKHINSSLHCPSFFCLPWLCYNAKCRTYAFFLLLFLYFVVLEPYDGMHGMVYYAD